MSLTLNVDDKEYVSNCELSLKQQKELKQLNIDPNPLTVHKLYEIMLMQLKNIHEHLKKKKKLKRKKTLSMSFFQQQSKDGRMYNNKIYKQ
jgi:hypothetical protein